MTAPQSPRLTARQIDALVAISAGAGTDASPRRRALRKNVPAEVVRKLLDYDPATGVFRWHRRTVAMFDGDARRAAANCARWNTRFAGTVAGTTGYGGYLFIGIFGQSYRAHRLAWLIVTGEWPKTEIDHINCDPGANHFANLRVASRSQNLANTRTPSTNTSGLKGVGWHTRADKWRATIKVNGKTIHLGLFDTTEAAQAAYREAATRFQGEFARVS